MSNIIDYIQWRGDLSLQLDSFNTVDNLILARLSYLDFNDLPPHGETLNSIAKRYIDSEEKMNPGLLLNEGNRPLLENTGRSQRFGSVVVKDFVSKIDLKTQLQFSAITYEIDKNSAYIAFRGTDDTIVGWKEDFNMTFMDVVPAQIEAADYLEDIISKYHYKSIYVGGHSKGGNLSVYASVKLAKTEKHRIINVFNNDGPGFKNSLINSSSYKDISDKIITLVPKSSIVGLLLEHEEHYKVVESNQKGIMQHDGFSWEVKGKDFVYLPELTEDALVLKKTSKAMLEKMSLEQREVFGTILFNILSVDESKTLTDLSNGGLGSLFKMSSNYSKMDWETKKIVLKTLSAFFDESYKSYMEVTELDQWRKKLKNWHRETKDEIDTFITKLIE